MEQVGIYIRVSTEEQATEGTSLQAQRRKLLAYCESQSWSVAGVYADEGISGSTIEKRPQATKMLDDAKKGIINHILILKVDRLCRNTRNLLEIVDLCKQYNVRLSAVEEQIDYTTPTGKMMLTMLGSFAELERATITARMVGGKEQKNRNGYVVHSSWLPYGYRREGDMLVPDPVDAEFFKKLVHMYVDEQLSANQICRILRDSGVRRNIRKPNALWKPGVLYNTFRNPVYKGYTRYHRTVGEMIAVPAKNVVPILTEEEWDNLNRILDVRTKVNARKNTRYPSCNFYFGSVLYCSVCKRKLITIFVDRMKEGKLQRFHYYQCKWSKPAEVVDDPCSNKGMCTQESVETNFINKLKDFVIFNSEPSSTAADLPSTTTQEKEILKMQDKKKRLLDLYLNEGIDQETYSQKIKEIDDKITILTDSVDAIKKSISDIELDNKNLGKLKDLSKNIIAIWSILTPQEKRQFVDSCIKRIDYNKKEGIVNILWNIK